MKRKLLSLAVALLCSVLASAYTTTDLTNAGWTQMTELPTPLSDYYFVFVDNGGNLMLDYANGSSKQGTDTKTMYYRTNADPISTPTMVWTLADNTAVVGTYCIKNATEPTLYLQTEYHESNTTHTSAWLCHTHDNGGGAGVDRDWCAYAIAYNGSKWTIQTYRERTQPNCYVGPWDNSFTDGAEVAGNKEGESTGYFQIYAIKRSKATPLNFTASKISNPSFESATAANQDSMTDWTNNGMKTQDNSFINKAGTYYVEAWEPNGTKSISRTISGLPAGQYCLSAHCKARSVTSAKIYAGSNETPITIADSEADYYVYFTNNGSSNVSIGFEGVGTGVGASWLCVDNFQLKYYGTKVNEAAIDMPSNGSMGANGWYSVIIPTTGNYNVTSTSAATIYYTQDGTTSVDAGTSLSFTAGEQKSLSLSAGTLFIMSSVSQVVDVDTRFYLVTTVNDERKWLNKNADGITYAYDKGLPFKLESSNGNAVLNFGDGNYLNDVGSNWITKAEGSNNNEWKLQSEEGGYKLLLGINNDCQLFVKDTSTGLVEITHSTNDGNIWQFIQPETALSYAIADAAAHTLGFENGEYAPYSNVTAVTALATARVATTNDARISAYTALTSATWTANGSEMNAIYNGNFALSEDNSAPAGWTLTGATGTGDSNNTLGGTFRPRAFVLTSGDNYAKLATFGQGDDTRSAFYFRFDNRTAKTAVYTYGVTEGYTMPLKTNKIYKLTAKVGGWGHTKDIKVAIVNTSDVNVVAQTLTLNNVDNSEEASDYEMYFVVPEAGNYKMQLTNATEGQDNAAIISNIELKSTNALVLANGTVYATGTYPAVELDRTFTTNWATVCVPFAFVKSNFAEVKELTDITVTGDHISMTLSDAESITAGKPYLVKANDNGDVLTATNVMVGASVQNTSIEECGYTVTYNGTYEGTSLNATDDGNAWFVSSNNLYHVASNVTVGAYRAYFTVDSSNPVKAMSFDFDGETGITNLNVNDNLNKNEAIYNLAGQRVSKAVKGLYIKNGKKVVIK